MLKLELENYIEWYEEIRQPLMEEYLDFVSRCTIEVKENE